MGKKKSAKKRRSSVKSHAELTNLRRISLLDSATPEPKAKPKDSDIATPRTELTKESDNGRLPRQRIDFVLPRAHGKRPQAYVFDKKRKQNGYKITQPAIQEEEERKQLENERSNETIDDILFPNRRRKPSEDRQSLGTTSTDSSKASRPTATIKNGIFMLTQASNIDETEQSSSGIDDAILQSPKSKKDQKQRKDPMSPSSPGRMSGLSVEDAVKDKYGLRPRANSTDGELKLPQRGLCDEQMVLESHKWNQDQNYVHQVVPKGFANLGNTCFLNATLQCLAYLPPFCQSILAISDSKQRLSKKMKKKLSQGQRITSILASLFQKIHSFDEENRGSAIAPHGIVKALPTIGTCGSRNGYKFRPGRQEDAHEFLVHLLDAMHDGELRAAGINQQESGWRDRLPVPRLDETTFIHRIFGGYFRSQVRCGSCGYCSNTYDPFLDLSLEVSKKTCRSILNSLDDFTCKETLDSDNRWKCSGCSKRVRATKQLTVFRPPLSLCIQLKRFSFEGGFGARGYSAYGTGGWKYGKSNSKFGGGGKITKPIEFPGQLNLPLSDSRSCQYALTGVVIHVGGSASSGHYTAYIKKAGRKGKDQWFHVDDSFVEPVPEKTVLRQRDAYLLFYCRKEVKLEFPSPPTQGGMSAAEAVKVIRERAKAKARADSISKDSPSEASSTEDIESKQKGKMTSPAGVGNYNAPIKSDSDSYDSDFDPTKVADSSDSDSASVDQEIAERNSEGTTLVMKRTKATTHPLSSPLAITKDKKSGKTESQLGQAVFNIAQEHVVDERDSDSSDSDFDPENQSSNEESDSSSSTNERDTIPKVSGDSKRTASTEGNAYDESSSDGSSSSADDSSSGDDDDDGSNDSSSDNEPSSKMKTQAIKDGVVNSPARNSDDESSSSSGESGQSSSSSDSDEPDRQKQIKPLQFSPSEAVTKATTPVESSPAENVSSKRTRVVIDRKDARGKIQVMMGPKKKKHWQSKVATVGAKGSEFELLGNLSVSKWDDEDDKPVGDTQSPSKTSTSEERQKIIAKINKEESSRKRKHHLDRWDAHLDQGRLKKTKKDKVNKQASMFGQIPKNNVFQKIQSSVSRMKRGKPKGFFQSKGRVTSTAASHRKSR